MVDGVIFHARADAEKEIPGKFVRNRKIASHCSGETSIYTLAVPAKSICGFLERFGTWDALRPETERTVGPDVDFADLPDCSCLNVLDGGAGVV
jgi:hypothetical protein